MLVNKLKNKKKNKIYRQGDVLITSIESIPSNLKKTNRVTLALGEVTGHHHSIMDNCVGFAPNESDLAEYLNVSSKGAELTHQEHSTITLPPGKYSVTRQVEYTPEALRNVTD